MVEILLLAASHSKISWLTPAPFHSFASCLPPNPLRPTILQTLMISWGQQDSRLLSPIKGIRYNLRTCTALGSAVHSQTREAFQASSSPTTPPHPILGLPSFSTWLCRKSPLSLSKALFLFCHSAFSFFFFKSSVKC